MGVGPARAKTQARQATAGTCSPAKPRTPPRHGRLRNQISASTPLWPSAHTHTHLTDSTPAHLSYVLGATWSRGGLGSDVAAAASGAGWAAGGVLGADATAMLPGAATTCAARVVTGTSAPGGAGAPTGDELARAGRLLGEGGAPAGGCGLSGEGSCWLGWGSCCGCG